MVKRLTLFLALFITLQSEAGVLLNSLIDDIIDRELTTANFSMVIKDPETAEIIYQHNAHKYLSPASNTKLFPAIAGLLALGQDYQYKTEVGFNPKQLRNQILSGNLYIRFSGDPTLTDKQLGQLLAKTGIRQVNGTIYLDKQRFSLPDIPLGTSYDDIGWYYAARTSAIILNENAFKVLFRAGRFKNSKIVVKNVDKPYGIRINTHVKTVSDKATKQKCDLIVRPSGQDKINLFGCWPASKKERPERLAIPDPVYWASQIIRTKMREHHIRFFGKILEGPWANEATVAATHRSWALKDILKHMLYESDNLYADSLAKTIGAEIKGTGSYKAGSQAIKDILKKHMLVNIDDMIITDGAGSRYNLMTTLQIAELLSAAYMKSNIRAPLLHALPLSGVRGSIARRMNDFNLRGKVYAKTGSMHDISSLAGYIKLPSKRTLVFAMITNNYNGRIDRLKKLEDQIVQAIWSSES